MVIVIMMRTIHTTDPWAMRTHIYIHTYKYTSVGELRPPPVLVVISILQADHVRRIGQHLAQQQLSPYVPVLDSGVRLVGILEIRQYVVADEAEARHRWWPIAITGWCPPKIRMRVMLVLSDLLCWWSSGYLLSAHPAGSVHPSLSCISTTSIINITRSSTGGLLLLLLLHLESQHTWRDQVSCVCGIAFIAVTILYYTILHYTLLHYTMQAMLCYTTVC